MLLFQIRKNPNVTSIITAVANQPAAIIGQGKVRRPIMRGFTAITIMTAMRGAASTPLTTALQYKALIGSSDVKLRAAPAMVAAAIVA